MSATLQIILIVFLYTCYIITGAIIAYAIATYNDFQNDELNALSSIMILLFWPIAIIIFAIQFIIGFFKRN